MGDYCTLQEIRDEGITTQEAGDTRVTSLISTSSRLIEKWTGRWFESRTLTIDRDGKNSSMLYLDIPIISITAISLLNPDATVSQVLDSSVYKVYNRHVSSNLLDPDDRDNPRIEIVSSLYFPAMRLMRFPRGSQNVRLEGKFGYTDYDGTATGTIPPLIKQACKLLVIRELPKMGDWSRRRARQKQYLVASEQHGTTMYTMNRLEIGVFSGDPDIDRIIGMYQRPPRIGAV